MSNKLTTFRGCRHYLHFTQTLSELELPLPGDITPHSVQYTLQSHPWTTQDVYTVSHSGTCCYSCLNYGVNESDYAFPAQARDDHVLNLRPIFCKTG